MTLEVVANKLNSADDVAMITERVGDDYLTGLQTSEYVRQLEKGNMGELSHMEPANVDALAKMLKTVDAQRKDWDKYYRQAVEFHIRSAQAWGNAQLGLDLVTQIDRRFDLSAAIVAGGLFS